MHCSAEINLHAFVFLKIRLNASSASLRRCWKSEARPKVGPALDRINRHTPKSQTSNTLATRNFNSLCRNPPIIRTKQTGNHRADIVRYADTPHRRDSREELLVLGRIAHRPTEEVGFDGA